MKFGRSRSLKRQSLFFRMCLRLNHKMLRCQFLVLDILLTMAPKLDKVMVLHSPTVRIMEQSLAHLQALMLDVVGPLTDLLEKISKSSPNDGEEEQGVDLQLVEDLFNQTLPFWGMQLSGFLVLKILEE